MTRGGSPQLASWLGVLASLSATVSTMALLCGRALAAEAPRPPQELRDLAIDRRIGATLTPGETQRYRLDLRADRGVIIVAEQTEIDVKLALRALGGAELAQADLRSSGSELLLAIAPRDGQYELDISAAGDKVPAGRYSVIASVAGNDAAHRAAFQHHLEGLKLAAQGPDHRVEARQELDAALKAWNDLGQDSMAASCLFQMAHLSKLLRKLAEAKEAYAEAARRFENLGQIADRAAAESDLGEAIDEEGDSRGAAAQYKSTFALEGFLTPVDRVVLHFNYGSDLKELGDYDESLASMQSARVAFHDLGMTYEELVARTEIGGLYVMQRDPVSALQELTQGVALSREAARPDMEARFLQRLGVVYWQAGDSDSAAEQWQAALALHRSAGNKVGEGAVLLQLGDCAEHQDDPATASSDYQQALDILVAAGSKSGEARALEKLGEALEKRGEHAAAAEMERRGLEIYRAEGDQQGEIAALLALARTTSATGDRAAAQELLKEALSISRGPGAGFAETDILGERAKIESEEGATTQALATLDDLLAKIEARQRAALVPSLQATIGGNAQVWYAARTEILMRRNLTSPRAGWDVKGFESAERARARAFLGMLAESHADIRAGVEPALLERYRALQAQISAAETAGAAGASPPAEGKTAAGASTSGGREIADLTARLQLMEAEIRKSSPSYAALTQPTPVGLPEIRKRVLDSDTVLIEYALGESHSWLWAVTGDSLLSAPLPAAAQIEAAARSLYQRMSLRPSGQPAGGMESDLAALGRMLLSPIADKLAGPWRGRRLAIVSAGALEFIPFGVLPTVAAQGAGTTPARRLIDDHEIVFLPSASVLDLMRRETGGRPAAPLRIALMGDPVFAADDPRVRRDPNAPAATAGVPQSASSDPISRSALMAGGARGFPRLPFSRDEVQAIAALLPEAEALKATDFAASRALATGGTLGGYRILHLATHGLLNTAHPELSGLVLSLVDEDGRPLDGFLRLQDIYNLRLSADLAVLSACRTALGRQIEGEGLVGLTRGFMYAGVPRVVASLWQVDDSATAELMREFYRGMFTDRLRPAVALRAAQLKIAAQPRWAAPYFWAGFTFEGEWR